MADKHPPPGTDELRGSVRFDIDDEEPVTARVGGHDEGSEAIEGHAAIERFSSASPWEPAVGYSRAVRAGSLVFVAGTTAIGPKGELLVEGDAYVQTLQALHNVEAALRQAGASLAQVVQTRLVSSIRRCWSRSRRSRVRICTISCWEVTMLATRGRLRLALETELWVRRGLAHPRAVELPLTSKVAVRAALLRSQGFESDPADEIIYATARANGSPLVTRDAALREFDPRATVW